MPLTWEEYRDWQRSKREGPLEAMALGLAGETGEVVDIVKKVVYHGRMTEMGLISDELGDVVFYLTAILDMTGFTLEDIMKLNQVKLDARYPDGFVPGGGVR